MSVERALAAVQDREAAGSFQKVESLAQGAVLRLLSALGWDPLDPDAVRLSMREGVAIICLEAPTGTRRVSICINIQEPSEASPPRSTATQLVDAPLRVGVVGHRWCFYASSRPTQPFLQLDLTATESPEIVRALRTYLAEEEVRSGRAGEAAEHASTAVELEKRRREAIPRAWTQLLQNQNGELAEVINKRVQALVGSRVDKAEIFDFLHRLSAAEEAPRRPAPSYAVRPDPSPAPAPPPVPPVPASGGMGNNRVTPYSPGDGTLVLLGQEHAYHNAIEAVRIVLHGLLKRDPTLMHKLAAHPDNQGRIRKMVAKTEEELYPGRRDLQHQKLKVAGGWLVATNTSNVQKEAFLRRVCEVSGLLWGKDLVITFPETASGSA